jgi:GDP-L-fucose synthase
MPTNLYGPGDNYDLQTSHVLPALIRKIHEAKRLLQPEVVVWGTGIPLREFLYSDDFADACIYLMSLDDQLYGSLLSDDFPPLINIGYGSDVTIRQLAETIAKIVGYDGRLVFDRSKPDGTPRKLLDSSRIRALGWAPKVELEAGIRLAFDAAREGLDFRLATVQI